MTRFEIRLQGENYLLNIDGEPQRFGFFTTRLVRAESPEQAVKIAIIKVHQDAYLQSSVINEGQNRPSLRLVEVRKIGFFRYLRRKSAKGFSFYEEEDPCR